MTVHAVAAQRRGFGLAFLFALASHLGCDSVDEAIRDASRDAPAIAEPQSPDWRTAIERMNHGGGSFTVFSFSFVGPPPGNAGLHLLAIDRADAHTCREAVEPSSSVPDPEAIVWHLNVFTSHAERREYPVTERYAEPSPEPRARAVLSAFQNGRELQKRVAVGGRVVIVDGPANETQWVSTRTAVVDADLEFLETNVNEVGCFGSQMKDGPAMVECTCRGEATEFHCRRQPEVEERSCCFDGNAPRVRFSLRLSGEACLPLCKGSFFFYSRCNALNAIPDASAP